MPSPQEVRNALINFIRQTVGAGFSMTATVLSVDENDNTMVVEEDGLEIPNVRLQAVEDGTKGFTIFPKIGTWVFCIKSIEDNSWQALKYGEIQKIRINAIEVVFNDGQQDGLVLLNPLVDKLNALENDLNILKTAFNSWTPVPSDGGAALKASAASWAASSLNNTVKSDLENTAIRQ